MSAIVAVAGRSVGPAEQTLLRMLDPMASRGAEERSTWRNEVAALATGRHAWELDPAHSGAVGVLAEGEQVVAADATLYHQGELRRRLRDAGIEPGPTSSHLILAAFFPGIVAGGAVTVAFFLTLMAVYLGISWLAAREGH